MNANTASCTISARASGSTTSPARCSTTARCALHRRFSITGLTSNPTIFDEAIGRPAPTTTRSATTARAASSDEELFFELALKTCARRRSVSPGVRCHRRRRRLGLAGSVAAARRRRRQAPSRRRRDCTRTAARPNLFVKIPGTPAGVPAIEESIFHGVPVNVTLLFSREQYLAAAEAYLRGIERRIAAGLDPRVASVASLFVSRWDVAARTRCRPRCATGSASPSPAHLQAIANCCIAALAGSPPPARGRNACCGRAPAPRIRTRPTRSMSRRSPRPTRSTRCRRRHCTPSPTTARSGAPMPPTAATPRRCSPNSRAPASTSTRSPPAAAGRRGGVREVMEGTAGAHRRQERALQPDEGRSA